MSGTSSQFYRATRFHVTVRPLVGCNSYVRTVEPLTFTLRASLAAEFPSITAAEAVARLARAAGRRAMARTVHHSAPKPQRRIEA